MERKNKSTYLATEILATILIFSALIQSNVIQISSSEASQVSTISDPVNDLIYIYTKQPVPLAGYLNYVDVTEVVVENKTNSLWCAIGLVQGPPVNLQNTIFYTFMFDENDDPSDDCKSYPTQDVDTMYTVIYTKTGGCTIERAKYQVLGEWWMVESTNADYGLASSLPGGFSVSIWIPLTELPDLSRVLPWKVKTETFNYPSTFPPTGDFAPDEGLVYLPPLPPAGLDIVDGDYVLGLEIFGVGIDSIALEGPAAVVRSAPGDVDQDSLADIATEIVGMRLTGNDGVLGQVESYVTPDVPSKGLIEELESGTGFPAESYFDVFVEVVIEKENLTLINLDPLQLKATIDAIPPFGTKYIAGVIPLYDKLNPAISVGKINYFFLTEKRPEKEIKLAFHIPEDLLKQKKLTKDDMERIIDEMLNGRPEIPEQHQRAWKGVNKLWKPADISFIKAKLVIENFTKYPSRADRDQLREKANKEQPSFYPVFLVESFPDELGAQGLATKRGVFLSQNGWTDDPIRKNDDNDPNNGWNGEDPPDEVLAHELGHALCLGDYTTENKRHKLMNTNEPAGTDLNPEDIEKARKSDLAHKYEPTRTDPKGDYVDPIRPPHTDVLCCIATVDLIDTSLNLGMGIKAAGSIPDSAGENDGYSFVIDTDNNPTTGATDPLLRGGEALASLRYDVGVGWTSELSTYNAVAHRWTSVGTFRFEVFFDTGFVFMLVPMDAIGMSEGALITWKAFTLDGGDLADVTGYVIMETAPYLLPVKPEHEPRTFTPTADFTYTPAHPTPSGIITFDASSSFHPNSSRTIISYAWDLGDGNLDSGIIAQHVYPERGVYTVNLTITDDMGLQSWIIQTLRVTEFPTDLNGDRVVNIIDIAIVALAFGSVPEHPKWNPDADLDDNNVINVLDIAKVAKDFGKIY